ncbi:MAG: ester cyclase [Pseudomonadota bacterium]
MTPEAMKAHLAAFFDEVWNRRDLMRLERYIAPVYKIRSDPGDPWDGKSLTRAEFAERLTVSCAPFPDQKFTILDLIVEGERLVVDWRWAGTHLADLPGFPASGKAVKISGLTIYDFENGLLSGHRQQADRLSVLQQLMAKG